MEPRRLRRSRRNRWLVGVCGGFGERFGFPPLVLRLVLIVATLFSPILVPLAYLLAWFVIPEEPQEVEPWPPHGGPEDGNEGGQTEPASFEPNPSDAGRYTSEPQPEEDKPQDPWAR